MWWAMAALAVLMGYALGGRLSRLAQCRLRWPALLLLPVAAALLTRLRAPGAWMASLGPPAEVAAAVLRYGSLVVFAALNRRVRSVCLVGLGGLANSVVTLANAGAMPVSRAALSVAPADVSLRMLEAGRVFSYRLAGPSTRLGFLGDVIPVRLSAVYFLSAGDILVAGGVAALILELMGALPPRRILWHRLRR